MPWDERPVGGGAKEASEGAATDALGPITSYELELRMQQLSDLASAQAHEGGDIKLAQICLALIKLAAQVRAANRRANAGVITDVDILTSNGPFAGLLESKEARG